MDKGWTPCQYFQFWDFPRVLVIQRSGQTMLLNCPFDELLDDYSPTYRVWELEPMEPNFALIATWHEIERRKLKRLQDLPTTALEFWPKRERNGQSSHAWYRFKSD